ncbi:MAG: hypothetical protein F6K41_09410 [Symploca sp. SIO3E6]|nr:hypothetical protein [Caldora sp. SIO3E6]
MFFLRRIHEFTKKVINSLNYSSYKFTDAQQLLIKPFDRTKFIILFIVATLLAEIIIFFITKQGFFEVLWPIQNQYLIAIIIGTITGSITGTFQLFIISRYIPDWKWILVACFNIILIKFTSNSMGDLWKLLTLQVDKITLSLFVIYFIVLYFSLIVTLLICGYLQWSILRPYVINAQWWVFVPAISVVLSSIIIFLRLYSIHFNYSIRLDLAYVSLILPATMAIAFCILRKKSTKKNNTFNDYLALAPDIVDFWEIQELSQKLYQRISKIWLTDLGMSIGKLSYLVVINRSGNIILFQGMNQRSIAHVDETPLPQVASNSSYEDLVVGETVTEVAKFQVEFTPPSQIAIHSWRGIPLFWLGITTYAVIIAMGVVIPNLGRLPPLFGE